MDCFDSNIDNDNTFDDSDNEEVYFMFDEEFTTEELCDGCDEDEELYAMWDEEDDFEIIDPEPVRYFFRPISVRKGTVTQHGITVGHIRNRIYVNSTFKAISTEVIGDIPYQSVKQCVFINCNWAFSDISFITIENVKFINCKFYNSELPFSTMKNVTFENCTFINSRGSYDDYESNINMINSTFFEIYEIVDLGK